MHSIFYIGPSLAKIHTALVPGSKANLCSYTAKQAVGRIDCSHLFRGQLAHFLRVPFKAIRMPLAYLLPVRSLDLISGTTWCDAQELTCECLRHGTV